MNSSPQSLLTLMDFIRDVSCQEEMWRSLPEAELIRILKNILRCHCSINICHKLRAFQDHNHNIRSLSLLLQEVTASVGGKVNETIRSVLVQSLSPSAGNVGHHMSNRAYPDAKKDDPADRWITYNDSEDTKTTSASVCERRQRTSYILFCLKSCHILNKGKKEQKTRDMISSKTVTLNDSERKLKYLNCLHEPCVTLLQRAIDGKSAMLT